MATEFNTRTSFERSPPPTSHVDDDMWGEEWNEDIDEGLSIPPQRLAQVLGWFSVGLGIAELLAPRAVARAIGVGEQPALLRMCGVREIISGVGLLSERRPGKWALARVAGDAIDLGLLGASTRQPGADFGRIALAATAVAGVTALDVYASQRLNEIESPHEPIEAVSMSITINAPPEVIYSFWRNPENFPRFMAHLEEVKTTGERTSHWIAKAPAGTCVEWDAEITEDETNSRIAWRTLPDSSVEHEGIVSFEPASGGRGTIVRVSMSYVPPAGKVGVLFAKLFGEEPSLQINGDLRRLKQLIETGEVATTEGQPTGRRSIVGRATLGRWMS